MQQLIVLIKYTYHDDFDLYQDEIVGLFDSLEFEKAIDWIIAQEMLKNNLVKEKNENILKFNNGIFYNYKTVKINSFLEENTFQIILN
jgi:hypothetical protein